MEFITANKENEPSPEIQIKLARQIYNIASRFKEDLGKVLIPLEESQRKSKLDHSDLQRKLNRLRNIIISRIKQMVSISEGYYFALGQTELVIKKWHPVCLNVRKSILESRIVNEKSEDKFFMIKRCKPLKLGFYSKQSTLTRELTRKVNDKRINILNSFKIDVYYERINGDEIELYKGGWNPDGLVQGIGIFYRLDKERNIKKAYKGEFYRDKMRGFGMIFSFFQTEHQLPFRFKVVAGQFEKGELRCKLGEKMFIYRGRDGKEDVFEEEGG